jgi:hypothetical protein
VVYNDISRSDIGFEVGENEVVLVSDGADQRVAKAPKRAIAAAILDAAEAFLP